MKEIKAYQCDYCKKYSKSKSYMKHHEEECYHNPVTRACATCRHFQQIEVQVDNEYPSFRNKPICARGVTLTFPDPLYPGDFKVILQHHCPFWGKKI